MPTSDPGEKGLEKKAGVNARRAGGFAGVGGKEEKIHLLTGRSENGRPEIGAPTRRDRRYYLRHAQSDKTCCHAPSFSTPIHVSRGGRQTY